MVQYVANDTYYITSGGKIPLKWTASEVWFIANIIIYQQYNYIYKIMCYRQSFTKSIQHKVMCGALVV